MSEHNTFTAAPGKIVIYGEWVVAAYVEYQAYIRSVVSTPAGEDEPIINLTYNDGIGAANQANGISNIELISPQDDYWRAQFDPNISASRPETITRPNAGGVVWLGIYDSSIAEHRFRLGTVRSIPGNPSNPEPNLNVSYYDEILENDVNANQVVPFPAAGATDDYWFDLKDLSE